MIVQHYLQLLTHYRRVILAIIGLTAVMGGTLNAIRLVTSPSYTAAASVAVLPTEAEFAFGRDVGGGPRGTSRALTATYMEYLKSRPVVESALDRIGTRMGEDANGIAVQSRLAGSVKGVVGLLRRTYRRLDSGRHVPLSPREEAIQRLSEAIGLQTVADSYILRVEVSLPNPETAATAANALAEAYVQRVSEQLTTSMGPIGAFLDEQIALREAEMDALRAREDRLKAGVSAPSLEEELNVLVRTREAERQKLADAQDELNAAEAQLEALRDQNPVLSGRSLAELSETRSQATARRETARMKVESRQRSLRNLSATLEALKQKGEPLLAVQRRFDVVKQELAELQNRKLSADLTHSTASAQVRVIDPAVAPLYPSSPHAVRDTGLALLAGVVVSLMVIVLMDSISETLKTTADLERLAGPRSLGLLPRGLLARATDVSGSSPGALSNVRKRLSSLGANLERALTIVGAFEAPVIQVTGFLDAHRLVGAAATIGAAVASRGRRVFCKLPRDFPAPKGFKTITHDELFFAAEERQDRPQVGIRLECLPPVSSELSISEAARRSPALVCVVPTGEVPEQDVKDFLDRALQSGMSAVSFVLLES